MISMLGAAVALWLWPAANPVRASGADRPGPSVPRGGAGLPGRRRSGSGRTSTAATDRVRRVVRCAAVLLGGLLVGIATDPAVGVAAAMLGGTVTALVRGELRQVRIRRERLVVLAGLRALAREVRAGAAPEAAVWATAEAHPGAGRAAMDMLAAAMPLADPLGWWVARPDRSATGPVVGQVMGPLLAGWELAGRFGVPWAGLLDALTADVAEQVRLDEDRQTALAGPRFSGYVLAALPGLGVLLGTGMGADPLHVLLATGPGGVMTVVGVGLTCLGLSWTARIVRR